MTAQSIPAPSWAKGPIVDDEEVRYDITLATMQARSEIGLTRVDVGPEPGETSIYAFEEVFTPSQAREVARLLVHGADLADAG